MGANVKERSLADRVAEAEQELADATARIEALGEEIRAATLAEQDASELRPERDQLQARVGVIEENLKILSWSLEAERAAEEVVRATRERDDADDALLEARAATTDAVAAFAAIEVEVLEAVEAAARRLVDAARAAVAAEVAERAASVRLISATAAVGDPVTVPPVTAVAERVHRQLVHPWLRRLWDAAARAAVRPPQRPLDDAVTIAGVIAQLSNSADLYLRAKAEGTR